LSGANIIGGGTDTYGNADIYQNVENIIGSQLDDVIRGSRVRNELEGRDGNDILAGEGGNDFLNGNNGMDTADYSEKTLGITVVLNGGNNVNVKVGTVNEDTIREIESIWGGKGADNLTGDGNMNTFRGNAGKDVLNGGANSDTADYSDKTAAVTVTLNAATAVGVKVGAAVEDSIRNIENIIGGKVADVITGDGLANTFFGNAGNDVLKGMGGVDNLFGGAGRDTLTGGAQGDFFRYLAVTDSGVTAATRDYITDFSKAGVNGIDKIDLSVLDNDSNALNGNGSFTFLTMGTVNSAVGTGQIGWYQVNSANNALDRTIIRVNNDADAADDMTIELFGLVNLQATDFML
jgi:Ca2+-binding RTX toxin-like protein